MHAQPLILQAIRDLLTAHAAEFKEIHHAPTHTSEQSAQARGESVRIGGKAIVAKVGETFGLYVLSAARKLDSVAIRRRRDERRFRFATPEELLTLTGLVPGSVPPFGRPILPLDLHVDESIVANDRIAFNAGTLTDSIIMSVGDYLRITTPVVFNFSTEPV